MLLFLLSTPASNVDNNNVDDDNDKQEPNIQSILSYPIYIGYLSILSTIHTLNHTNLTGHTNWHTWRWLLSSSSFEEEQNQEHQIIKQNEYADIVTIEQNEWKVKVKRWKNYDKTKTENKTAQNTNKQQQTS